MIIITYAAIAMLMHDQNTQCHYIWGEHIITLNATVINYSEPDF